MRPPALTLTATALLLLLTPAAAHAVDDPAQVTANDLTITVTAGEELTVPIADFATGTEYPGLYDDNVTVTSGACDLSSTYASGRAGLDIALADSATEGCTLKVLPHDTMTSTTAATPATITVLAAPKPTPTPEPTAEPEPPQPETTTTATTAPSPTPRHGVPGWQQVLALVAAFGALGVGSTAAFGQHRRRTIHERSDQP